MGGILLTLGPVTTLSSVQRLSTIFNTAVRKARFMSAANQLQEANLGSFAEGFGGSGVFIKKPPEEAMPFLMLPENQDLCNPEEYAERYNKPPSCVITHKLQATLIQQGLVPPDHFKTRKVKPKKEPEQALEYGEALQQQSLMMYSDG